MFEVVYRETRGRISTLADTLDAGQLATPVPAAPKWTVQELLAHVVGVAADVSAGRTDGAPSDEWTERHVGERRQATVADLLNEWDRCGPLIEPGQRDAEPPNASFDLVCHEGDLHEALGIGRPDGAGWRPVLEATAGYLGRRLKQPGTLVVRASGGSRWVFGTGFPETTLRVDGYELLRGMFSRRSQRQIAGWQWSPAPAEQLARFGAFGPREDDQPVPA